MGVAVGVGVRSAGTALSTTSTGALAAAPAACASGAWLSAPPPKYAAANAAAASVKTTAMPTNVERMTGIIAHWRQS